jgi:hypothetical protein
MMAEDQAVDLVSDETGYERLRLGVMAAGIDADTFEYVPGRSPYSGLRALTEKDAALFFGREAQIVAGLDALRRMRSTGVRRALIILGASGSGKSSLMRAGLWPCLRRDGRNFLPLAVLRPERAALSGDEGLHQVLEAALSDAAGTGQLASDLPATRGAIGRYLQREGGRGLAAMIEAVARAHQRPPIETEADHPKPPCVVLPVDQMEELWGADAGEEADRLIALLGEAIEGSSHLLVMATLRSPSYPLLQNERRIPEDRQELFTLGPMPEGSFRSVIEKPASLAHLRLEPALIEKLLQDLAGKESLPLLAFTLERLYRQFGADGDLTKAEYDQLGGMSGAIEASATNALIEARKRRLASNDNDLELLLKRALLPHLVRVDDQDGFLGRVARLAEIPPECHELIGLLVDQRLLIRDRRGVTHSESTLEHHSDDSRAKYDVIEVSHEAILREWRLLHGWLVDEREHLIWRHRVDQAWRDWKTTATERRREVLMTGLPLEAARQHRHDWVTNLPDKPDEQQRFVLESIEAKVRQRRRFLASLWGSGVLLIFLVILFIMLWIRADHQRAAAQAALAQSAVQEGTRLVVNEDDAARAASYFAHALRIEPDSLAAASWASDFLLNRLWWLPVAAMQHQGEVLFAVFSPDGRLVVSVSTDHTARVWDAGTGEPRSAVMRHQGSVRYAAFSPDNRFVVTASGDHTAQVWETATGKAAGVPLQHQEAVVSAAFLSEDRIVTVSWDHTARVWERLTGQPVGPAIRESFGSAAFSPDGRRFAATFGNGKFVEVWDVEAGKPVGPPLSFPNSVLCEFPASVRD